MRQEDKEVDGRDLERQQRLQESELVAKDEEQLPAVSLDQVRDLARVQQAKLLAAVQAIFARDHIVIDTLRLPQHELRALEALKVAVDGKDAQLAQFVYATDRHELLEQALAVLQPNLAIDDPSYARLVNEVSVLRAELTVLMDAQDELEEQEHKRHTKAEDTAESGDTDTAAKPAAGEQGDQATTTDVEKPKVSTLYGAEATSAAPAPSTLFGAEAVRAAPPSTLYGSDTAPATPPEPAPSTLGDPSDVAASQQQPPPKVKPWWKRPFG